MAKKILVKNNVVVDVANAVFEIHPDIGTWEDCSDDNVKKDWIVNSDNSVSAPPRPILTYEQKRQLEYPKIIDQLDDIYHNGIDAWKATIKATKDKYPKS